MYFGYLFQVKYYAQQSKHDLNAAKSARNILKAVMDESVLKLFTLKGGSSGKEKKRKFKLNERKIFSMMLSKLLFPVICVFLLFSFVKIF